MNLEPSQVLGTMLAIIVTFELAKLPSLVTVDSVVVKNIIRFFSCGVLTLVLLLGIVVDSALGEAKSLENIKKSQDVSYYMESDIND